MRSGFYTNYSEVKFIDKLRKNIDTCRAFFFSVSFIRKPGLRLLAPNIEAAIARGAKGRIITSTYNASIYLHWKGKDGIYRRFKEGQWSAPVPNPDGRSRAGRYLF